MAGLLLGGCATYAPSALDTHGPDSADIARLFWFMLGIASAVCLIVIGLLLFGVFRPRRGPAEERPRAADSRLGMWMIAIGGIAVPAAVLVGLMFFTVFTLRSVSALNDKNGITVDVIAHDWWWEARYPGANVVTANYIHIPAGQPVHFRLTSQDVIHSFWVPQLAGKTDVIPGQVNTTTLRADEPGEYRGQCAEYCGDQHAHMAFYIVADPPDRFTAWLAEQSRPAAAPTTPLAQRGQQVFLGNACINCHAIKGTPADARAAPDLTHLMSRPTIGAGILQTNRANLASWVTGARAVKPGVQMPSFDELSSDDLAALLAYLETLK